MKIQYFVTLTKNGKTTYNEFLSEEDADGFVKAFGPKATSKTVIYDREGEFEDADHRYVTSRIAFESFLEGLVNGQDSNDFSHEDFLFFLWHGLKDQLARMSKKYLNGLPIKNPEWEDLKEEIAEKKKVENSNGGN